jgi:hypothetical protein
MTCLLAYDGLRRRKSLLFDGPMPLMLAAASFPQIYLSLARFPEDYSKLCLVPLFTIYNERENLSFPVHHPVPIAVAYSWKIENACRICPLGSLAYMSLMNIKLMVHTRRATQIPD